MTDDEDWVMRPWTEGKCDYEHLIDGTYDLADVARMNEALDVRAENQARVEEALRGENK